MRTIKAIKIKDVIELLGYKEREYEFKGISGVRHIRYEDDYEDITYTTNRFISKHIVNKVKQVEETHSFVSSTDIVLNSGNFIHIWPDNLNTDEEHIRRTDNDIISPELRVIDDKHIVLSEELFRWLTSKHIQVEQKNIEEKAIYFDIEDIYVVKSKCLKNKHGYSIGEHLKFLLSETEIKKALSDITDETVRDKIDALIYGASKVASRRDIEDVRELEEGRNI